MKNLWLEQSNKMYKMGVAEEENYQQYTKKYIYLLYFWKHWKPIRKQEGKGVGEKKKTHKSSSLSRFFFFF